MLQQFSRSYIQIKANSKSNYNSCPVKTTKIRTLCYL